MTKIQPLPDPLINQIAAGEMIERPASILKELAENAIDAGATQINIVLEGGGIRKIRITDNGEGIGADELPLALMRHATSKIRAFDDLWHVQSMGFRGEALASIASAAQLHMMSNTTLDAAKGVSIQSEAGVIGTPEPVHHPRGTTIEVRDLFFNIPARRQFLKSEATEVSHCLETCRRLAMITPYVAWHVSHHSRKLLELPIREDTEIIKRWHDVLGEAFFSHSRYLEEAVGTDYEWKMRGVLILPSAMGTHLPARRESQYLYVNQRFVRDRTIVHALREGYGEMKHDAKTLAYVLMITAPPNGVDVNVSPTKTEVRFRQPGSVHQLVRQSVRKALAGMPGEYAAPILLPSSTQDASHKVPDPSQKHDATLSAFRQSPTQTQQPTLAIQPSHRAQDRQEQFYPKGLSEHFRKERTPQSHTTSSVSSTLDFYQRSTIEPNQTTVVSGGKWSIDNEIPPLGYALGLLHHLYILAQNADGLVVVEIHAAHERLLFEHLKQQTESTASNAQTLIVPWRIQLDEVQAATFEHYQEALKALGLHAHVQPYDEETEQEAYLNKTLVLEAIPSLLPEADYSVLIAEILHELAEYGHSAKITEWREQVMATMACHAARRGKQDMTINEMNALLREMEVIERSGTCNHGRPSYAVLPLEQIDHFFLRGQ